MLYLEKMKMHTITSGNYVTSVHGMVHPNRIIGEHDFLYILDGTWEIWEDDTSYALQSDDLLIPLFRSDNSPENHRFWL